MLLRAMRANAGKYLVCSLAGARAGAHLRNDCLFDIDP